MHHLVTRALMSVSQLTDMAVNILCLCLGDILVRAFQAQSVGADLMSVNLGHLDRRLLVDTEQGNVGDTDEGPLLVGPEHDDGTSLRGLSCHIKVGKAHTTQVGGQANEDVPVGKRRVCIRESYLRNSFM